MVTSYLSTCIRFIIVRLPETKIQMNYIVVPFLLDVQQFTKPTLYDNLCLMLFVRVHQVICFFSSSDFRSILLYSSSKDVISIFQQCGEEGEGGSLMADMENCIHHIKYVTTRFKYKLKES